MSILFFQYPLCYLLAERFLCNRKLLRNIPITQKNTRSKIPIAPGIPFYFE